MSRIGRAPITVPAGVEVKVAENNHITVKGPKGTLERDLVPQIKVEVNEGVINGSLDDGALCLRPQGNATRAEIAQMLMNYLEK